MTDYDTPPTTGWIRPCESAACIEVARHGPGWAIRSTEDPGAVIWATRAEWAAFVAGVKAGRFDQL